MEIDRPQDESVSEFSTEAMADTQPLDAASASESLSQTGEVATLTGAYSPEGGEEKIAGSDAGLAPEIVMTPGMLAVEAQTGEPINLLLQRLYADEKKSAVTIANMLGTTPASVYGWMRRCNIPTRPPAEVLELMTPEAEERRLAGMRQAWSERKDAIVAKIHAGDSDKRRGETRKTRHANDPEALEATRQNMRAANQAFREKMQQRRDAAFGDDIAKALEEMHTIHGLTVEDIAADTGYNEYHVLKLIRRYQIPYTIRTPQTTVQQFQEVHENLWARPEAMQALTEKQKHVIYQRFLTDGPVPTLEDVAAEMGVTGERVRQIEAKAMRSIRSATRRRRPTTVFQP